MQLQHPLLDRSGGDQLVDEHRLVLADAVGAVGGLIFHRRVPPGVVVDHRVGGGERQPDPASLEADQEQRHRLALERLDRRLAVDGVSGQLDEGNPGFGQFGLDQFQHAGELGEHIEGLIKQYYQWVALRFILCYALCYDSRDELS